MIEVVSEPITPYSAGFDAGAMGRGEPGLPLGFTCRGDSHRVTECLDRWKQSERESGRAGGELYLRRHYWRLRMDDRSVWTVYFLRQTPRSGSPKKRWFLYSIEREDVADADEM